MGLFIASCHTDTHESVWGILIGLVAKIGMPILAGYKLHAISCTMEGFTSAITCDYFSIMLMVGLAATRLFGWWWLDSLAALALIPFLVKEGRETAIGDGCFCHGD